MPMLNVERMNLYYQVKGEGIPIVFIHPPLLTSVNFVYQLEGLSKHYKVIIFDIRGHGRSEYSEQTITYSIIVQDIEALLDHLGIKKAFICGYSTGGSIVLEFLLAKANRSLGGIVISGMSEVRDLTLAQRISVAVRLSNAKFISFLSLAVTWGNANTRQLFKKMYRESSYGDIRNIRQYYRYSLHYNCTNQLPKIDSSVLLVYGSKDSSFHKYARLLHEKLPCNALVFLAKEKHQIPTKAAASLNECIHQFIQKHYLFTSIN